MSNMKPQRGRTPKKPAIPRKPKQTDPVEVYCRIRPIEEGVPICVKVLGPTALQLKPPEGSNAVRNGVVKESRFTFKFVFDEYTTQKAVFDQIALPCVEDVLKGKNALLFAYGITSSGKTHTMTGFPHDQGILPRCLDVVFNSIEKLQARKYVFRPDKMNGYEVQLEADAMMERQRRDILPPPQTPKTPRDNRIDYDKNSRVHDHSKVEDVEDDNAYSVFVSYVQIYNNYIYDLLEELQYDPITGYRQQTSKILREDRAANMYVSGAIEVEVKSTEEAYDVFMKGQKRRKVAHTALNTESSRSHSVFNIRLVQAPLDPIGEEVLQDKDKVVISQLSLVDLAGSERTKRTGNQGDRLREAGSINNSLMALKKCIEMLRENQLSGTNKMVPYRESRVTHLFKNHFDGEGKVRMIVCVNPKSIEYDETIHVMSFAELTQEVQVARPSQVRFETGLTKGRRRLNQQYKEAVRKDGDLPEPMVYSLGDIFPVLEVKNPDQIHIITSLIEFLRDRQKRRGTLLLDYTTKQEQFRQNLVATEHENMELKARLAELEGKLGTVNTDTSKMQRRIRSLEKANDELARTTNEYERERKLLENQLYDKDYRINQEKSEKDRLEQDYHARITLTERQYSRHISTIKRRAQEQVEAKVHAQKSQLRQIKQLVSTMSDTDSVNSRTRSRTTAATIVPTQSEPDLTTNTSYALRGNHQRAMTAYTKSVQQKPRAKSPPPVKPKPSVRYHRRSRSAHEVWVDHRPSPVYTDTLLQPRMPRKRSVTNLKEKDTKKATNYALTTQELDSEGDVATRVVKGDIARTSSGGTAVVFTDVETLKQKSPGDRKRRSPQLRPEDFEGEWTDPEERCRIAVEGHGHMKRIKTSQV